MTMKLKLYLHPDGRLLYSRNWPEVPEVQASINKDMLMMNHFERKMEYLCDPHRAIVVTNPLVCAYHGEYKPGTFYDVDFNYTIDSEKKTITLKP